MSGLGGDDTLQGWTGNDVLYGGGGFDFLDGWEGDDVLYGGGDADTLLGFDGADALYGGAGSDFLDGESGNDYLDGGAGLDFENGGLGDDTVAYDTAGTFGSHGGAGTDTLLLKEAGFNLDLTPIADFDMTGFEVIDITGTGNNTLSLQFTDVTAMSDTDVLTIVGDAGDAIVTPNETWVQGTDTTVSGVTYNVWTKAGGTLYVDTDIDQTGINSTTFTASTPASGGDSFGGILPDFGGATVGSSVEGSESADTLTGSELDDSIFGHGGNDTISGLGGSDYLQGDEGDDILYGGDGVDSLDGWTGADVLYGGAGGDVLLGFDGNDALYGGDGIDTLFGEFDNDFLDGGAGSDFLDGGPGNDILVFDSQDQLHRGTGTDTIQVDGSGVTVGLFGTSSNIINGIEVIDLTGSGANSLNVNDTDLTSKTDSGTLRVDGAAGDSVTSSSSWTSGGTIVIGANTYNVYTSGSATLQVQNTIGVTGITTTAPAATFTITDASALENSASLTFVVTRSDATAATTVDYATSNYGAPAGIDYTAQSGTLAFAAGESIKTITAAMTGDTVFERAESFAVTLSNATGGESISGAPATGTILNDEASLSLTNAIATKAVGAGGGFTISGANNFDYAGYSVSSAGDFKGDGYDDLLIGAKGENGSPTSTATHTLCSGGRRSLRARILVWQQSMASTESGSTASLAATMPGTR